MGLVYNIKKHFLTKKIDKQKAESRFDIVFSETYRLPPFASGEYSNSYFLWAHDPESGSSIRIRLGLRGGNAQDEAWLVYRDAEGNVFVPPCSNYNKGDDLPLTVACVSPGERIRFSYKGIVKAAKLVGNDDSADKIQDNQTQALDEPDTEPLADGISDDTADITDISEPAAPLPKKTAKIEDVFVAKSAKNRYEPDMDSPSIAFEASLFFDGITAVFDFAHDMSTEPVAHAFAKEKSTKELKELLNDTEQVQYEQSGYLNGTIKLADSVTEIQSMSALRSHAYGTRDWNYNIRHIRITALTESGEFMHISLERTPFIYELQTGYIRADGETHCLELATGLDDIPFDGAIPQKFAFDVRFEDKILRRILCDCDFVCAYKYGLYEIHEAVAAFDINGVRATGLVQFGGRSDKLC